MARIKLDLPDHFTFSTTLVVRVSDLNYGNHLGNDRMVSLLHEARLQFLLAHGYSEFNISGLGLIVTDLAVSFLAESFLGDELEFHIGVSDFNKYGCDFIYRVVNTGTEKLVAEAKIGIVFYDYDERKIARVPKLFYDAFAIKKSCAEQKSNSKTHDLQEEIIEHV